MKMTGHLKKDGKTLTLQDRYRGSHSRCDASYSRGDGPNEKMTPHLS